MALDTYANLKTEIADYLDRDDLSSNIDTFIDLAEARHARDIRIRQMIKRAQAFVAARYVALPNGFLQMKTMRLLTDPVTILQPINANEMDRRRQETTGKPIYFTVHEEIEFDKTPDATYTAEMIYFASFDALSDSNTTNGLLTLAPDAYLYGALVAAETFLLNDERVALWENEYARARDGLNSMDRRGRHPGPLKARVVGATP